MTIKGTIVSIAMIITLMVFAASQSKAQVEPVLPVPVLPAPPEITEEELPSTKMYRVNRNVPCADFNYVKSLLAGRGQQPIAQGFALDPSELMSQFILTYNESDSTFNIIVVDAGNKIACNLYSGAGFTVISTVN